jgi:hypothetical protein
VPPPGAPCSAIKPTLGTRMIGRGPEAGTPVAYVTGDKVYGSAPRLRASLEQWGLWRYEPTDRPL